jgi:hypothetical protein
MEGKGVLRFRLLAKTQFRDAEGEPMRDSLLKPGDTISVRFNAIDEETILFVHLVRAGTPEERTTGAAPVDPAAVKAPENLDAEDVAAPAPVAGSESPLEAPPVLRRLPRTEDAISEAVMPKSDAIIEAAREQAIGLNDALPNFLVQQHTTRSVGTPSPPSWQARDVVTAEVAYVNGAEEYREIRINGRPTAQPERTGSWSTGEFATTLQDVLSPFTGAAFTRLADQVSGNRTLAVYELVVPRSRSHWHIIAPTGEEHQPAYKGTIWIDKKTSHVIRIDKQSTSMPEDFPFTNAAWIVEYDAVRVDASVHMLPVRAENWTCQRNGGLCTRNETYFRNYRKFAAESEIKYDRFHTVADRNQNPVARD